MNDLDKIAKSVLPKTLNLHSMLANSVEMHSEPHYVNMGEPTYTLMGTTKRWKFQLEDRANKIKCEITITGQYEPI